MNARPGRAAGRVAILSSGDSFGEKALLRSASRSATVTALAAGRLWFLDGSDFVAAATGSEGPVVRRVLRTADLSLAETLAAVPLFGAIDRRELAASGERSSVADGAVIVREGEPGDAFYVLLEGELLVLIGGREVRRLAPGDWFGEIALLHSVPRTASVLAIGEARVWRLGREAFFTALGHDAPLGGPTAELDLAAAGLLV